MENAVGIPDGSILSIRAGNVRRQGSLPADKPVRFSGTGILEASPFKVDVFAPLGSARVVLKPKGDLYTVELDSKSGTNSSMQLDLRINEISEADDSMQSESRVVRRHRAMNETKSYIDEHELVQFVQNLMASVLAEKPKDPFAYMEQHLRVARAERCPPEQPSQVQQAPAPKTPENKVAALSRSKTMERIKAVEPTEGELVKPHSKTFHGPAFSIEDPHGKMTVLRPISSLDLIPTGSEVRRLKVHNLSDSFPSRNAETPFQKISWKFQDKDSYVTQCLSKRGGPRVFYQMHSAGPRQNLHFDPKGVVATIVTCGGLCPGLNAVIRELVINLYIYGAKKIWGIMGGYKGVVQPQNWIELTPESVQDIHNLGGTVLVSDRGNPTEAEQAASLKEMGVRQHFIIGGDGTHKGAYDMYETMAKMGWECTVIGIPKTIDNDIPMLDVTFGFDTACTEASQAIRAAYVEATCNKNCIGLVKLMGRHSGFIAMHTCLAERNVDICLLPEMNISLEKVLSHCLELMQKKKYAVIVVAEGCGTTLLESSGEKDEGGNIKMKDVGPWLRDKIYERFKQVKLPLTIKYIDPTYMIRAVKSNANDSIYCAVLAKNAVHAAMAGYTGVTIGKVMERYVLLPIPIVTKQKLNRVDTKGRFFLELISTTKQPDFSLDGDAQCQAPVAVEDEDPLKDYTLAINATSALFTNDEVRRLELENLSTNFGKKNVPTTLNEASQVGFMDNDSWVSQTLGGGSKDGSTALQMLFAGPRRTLHFVPSEVAATIVTCGGLCPGLNSVIRELVMTLYSYGVRKVYGIKGGYKGVVNPQAWVTLTPDNVQNIHRQGGSILISDRGNPPHLEMAKVLQKKGVRQHFVLGGDGTQKGAYQTFEQMKAINWECSVVGIPKTIDNDISLLDRSFGFDTAMSEAGRAIDVAYVEATCNANCIGLVKLMGRHCGYLTMMSVLGARHVDICLLPEMDITIDKFLDHCVSLLKGQGHAVVVVAEGCGENLLEESSDTDAGGNRKLADVGPWLKDKITSHFSGLKLPVTVKYVDPTYMVRAVPANTNDSIYCSDLAQAAVHAAMAGYTGLTVGKVDGNVVYLPIKMLTSLPSRRVDIKGRWFERLMATTQQPNLGGVGTELAKPLDPTKASARMPSRRRTLGPAAANTDELRVPDTKLTCVNGMGEIVETRPLERNDLLMESDEIRELVCFHLGERFGQFNHPSPLRGCGTNQFQDSSSWTMQAMFHGDRVDSGKGQPYFRMVRAGPREFLHFDPYDPAACAAIVSCGGICPGLNSVIREIVMSLWSYGVRRIYGVRGGYKGVVEPENWIELTPEKVQDIHLAGGTILISDRGNPEHLDMAKVLQEKGVRQYFVLGGDGTHKGAMQTFECCLEIDHECAVVGVPKTIDNDVPMFDQTFGFDSACTEAIKAVESAYVEARCNANCIGLVKLMGRHCGFIAMNAALAARNVDICLLPEMPIDFNKVLAHTEHLMKTKGHVVIVVAEGCGDTLVGGTGAKDAGGNKVLADVGPWIKNAITSRFKELKLPISIKYIDPTYMIRSVRANAYDSAYCAVLGQNAAHAAMAGYSGVTVGKVYERYVYLPIHAITQQNGRRVNPKGRWFSRLLETTGQPDFSPAGVPTPLAAGSAKASGNVLLQLSRQGSINDALQPGDEVKRFEVVNLSSKFTPANVVNQSVGEDCRVFLDENAWTTQTFIRANKRDDRGHVYFQMLRSGPRELLHFEPSKSSACIVTCGGLCPGLNSVIREIVMTLVNYGVTRIYGCRGGYKGMVLPDTWIDLSPNVVNNIHTKGGTILVSDRGNPPHIEIAKTLQAKKITQYFVIGGDGTQTGAFDTFTCTQQINHEVAVVGVPKTIDNDIPVLDRSFGFNTACSEAEKTIRSAYVEATCNANCIGLVKLMGRHCGFIAMHATLAARSVDICMLPEMSISLPKVLTHAMYLMKTKGHAVIVVAEGCGDTLLKSSGERDDGGNKKLADVGPWLKNQLLDYFKKMQVPLAIKYLDPTYMIRAVPANANDSVYCSVLAQQAVHGAMAGYSGVVVGKVDERYVMLPTHAITKSAARRVDLKSRPFERLLATTGQPDLSPGVGDDWALLPKPPPPKAEPQVEPDGPLEIDLLKWKGISHNDRPDTGVSLTAPIHDVKLKIFDGYGKVREEKSLTRADLMQAQDEVRQLHVMHLRDKYGSKEFLSTLKNQVNVEFLDDESWAVEAVSSSDRLDSGKGMPYFQMIRAGPREFLHFDPKDATGCAAIVTAGGLCPGENVVIREIVNMLTMYGASRIYGIRDGFAGIVERNDWIQMNPDMVKEIHNHGGCMLRTSRSSPSFKAMAQALKEKEVRQFFILGGDGTHRGALKLLAALADETHECSVMTVPSTVDNDIPMVDTTFGFVTACTEASNAIQAAYVEATCNANCIGLVKLLGIKGGFLALNATLASRNVDICLVPEMELSLEKILVHCEYLMQTKGYAVVVVAEGCRETLFNNSGETPEMNDVGPWLRDKLVQRFQSQSKPLTVKYIDPTYMVRSVPANASDSVYCSALAEHAVHGAMAGFTGVASVKVYDRYVYLPVHAVTMSKAKRVNIKGRWFGRLRFTTQQPSFSPDGLAPLSVVGGGDTKKKISSAVAMATLLRPQSEIQRLECVNLGECFASKDMSNPLRGTALVSEASCVSRGSWSTQTFQRRNSKEQSGRTYLQMLRLGPFDTIHFDPKEPDAAAALVTCGGLCPGLNNVIREIVKMLHAYGVQKVYGIIGGFKGCIKDDGWIELTEEYVQDIHKQGGSVLVSDRGNPPHPEIAEVLKKRNIRQYFVIGGDGTHQGAMQSFEAMTEISHECAVVGVPKTIDNDITLLDQTFGFDTACTEARRAIDSAYVEATTNANCIGLVKLMGRHCGWIAATATIAARHVDICLIPEMTISLGKVLDHVVTVMKRQRYAVIVVAEGCGDTLIEGTGEKDAGGNKILSDVGVYLKEQITTHCKKQQVPLTVKYIDPTYMIRSVPANAFDSMYCSNLAQGAVHAAMAGFTGITVGKVDERYVALPIHAIVHKGARKVSTKGHTFHRLKATTQQPNFDP